MDYPVGITCQQLVELVTDYLEEALSCEARARFERHLQACPPCGEYLQQMRKTIDVVGSLDEDAIDPTVRDTLLHVFRAWRTHL